MNDGPCCCGGDGDVRLHAAAAACCRRRRRRCSAAAGVWMRHVHACGRTCVRARMRKCIRVYVYVVCVCVFSRGVSVGIGVARLGYLLLLSHVPSPLPPQRQYRPCRKRPALTLYRLSDLHSSISSTGPKDARRYFLPCRTSTHPPAPKILPIYIASMTKRPRFPNTSRSIPRIRRTIAPRSD